MHHQAVVHDAARNLDMQDQLANTAQRRSSEQTTQRVQEGEIPLHEAQVKKTLADANTPVADEWIEAKNPEVDPGNKEVGAQTVFYNKNDPTKKRFGGASVAAHPTTGRTAPGTVHTDDEGYLLTVHPDGSASPVMLNGQRVKGQPKAEKTGDDFAQFYGKYLKDNNLQDTSKSMAQARKEWSASGQTPERPPQALAIVDDGHGGKVGQLIKPGASVGPGAQTMAGVNSFNTISGTAKSTATFAQSVADQVPSILKQIDDLKDKIGPSAGRWSQLWVNKGGMDDPAFAGLDQDLHLLASALVRVHFGLRGGADLVNKLEKQFGEAQSPEDLKARISHAETWIQGYANPKNPGSTGVKPQSAPQASSGSQWSLVK
jgi:hypothetical protein